MVIAIAVMTGIMTFSYWFLLAPRMYIAHLRRRTKLSLATFLFLILVATIITTAFALDLTLVV